MHEYKSGCVFEKLSDIKDKKVLVMGLGLNGGGEACVRFFLKYGALLTVTDMKTEEQLLSTIRKLEPFVEEAEKKYGGKRLSYVLGKHCIEDFENADCVIKNPGVKYDGNKYLAAAKNIESDISIFLHFTEAPIIAVTGSKGKSSTVSSIYYGLKQAGFNAYLGGNITVSPLTFLEETTAETPVVLELSSWQLADLRGRKALKPYISLITKIVPDHQNWYGNMESYVLDKRLIYADQTKGDYTIVDFDGDEEGTGPENAASWGDLFASESNATVLRYSREAQDDSDFYGVWQTKDEEGFCGKVFLPGMEKSEVILRDLFVPGEHMKINVLNAALVLFIMQVPSDKIIEIMRSWPGIEHRLQYFYTYKDNIRFYNDSCATVPEAVREASFSFDKPVILLTGGTDKGLSFEPITNAFASPENKNKLPKSIFLLEGTGTDKLKVLLDERKINYFGPFKSLDDMLKSVKNYIDDKKLNDEIVVFSPGATSFGMFANEFDRGEKFMKAVKELF